MRMVIVCVLLLIGLGAAAPPETCVLSITGKGGFFAPLFFTEDGNLLTLPKRSAYVEDYTLTAGQSVILSCAPNYFREYATEKITTLHATCIKNNELMINGQNVSNYRDLSCDLRPIEEIVAKVYDCPSDDRGVEYGFTNPVNNKSYVVGESCYCPDNARTIFVHQRLRHSSKAITDLSLKVRDQNYFKDVHPNMYYRLEFLKATNILKLQDTFADLAIPLEYEDVIVGRYINSDYLIHRQLQSVLHFTWNSYLQLKTVGESNLEVLQRDILELGVFDLEIYTGPHQTLKLPNKNTGAEVSVLLRGNKFPVPKFIWTVAKSDDKAAVFIYLNNPNVSEKIVEEIGDQFCQSKCSKISWITNLLQNNKYQDVGNGYIWCCEYKDVIDKILEIPELLDVRTMFK